jgi:hypothetical protein
MSDSGDSVRETLSTEEAFRLFSHELRIDVLIALWRAPEFRLAFSELQEAVGARDSGKFNYHLSKLTDQFVGHVGDEYELLYPGHRVIDAIQSGMLHRTAEIEPIGLQAPCPNCESSLEFRYAEYLAAVSCSECGELVVEFPFDPGGVVNRSPAEIVAAFDKRTRATWRLALDGVCPTCSGRVEIEPSVTAGKSPDVDHFGDDHPVVASLDCEQCSFYSYPPIGTALLDAPDVVCALERRGVDLRETRLWEIDFVADPARIAVRSTDPWEIDVTSGMGGDERRVRLDGSLSVQSVDGDVGGDGSDPDVDGGPER